MRCNQGMVCCMVGGEAARGGGRKGNLSQADLEVAAIKPESREQSRGEERRG
jgi:hypothetical protein